MEQGHHSILLCLTGCDTVWKRTQSEYDAKLQVTQQRRLANMSLVQNTLVKVERHILGKKHYCPAEGAHDMLSLSKTQNSVSVQGWDFTVIANRVTSKPNLRIHLLFFPYDYNTLRLFRRRSKKPTYRFCSERWKWVVCMPISAHAQWKYLHFFVTENVQSFTLGTKCQGMVGVHGFTFYIDLWFISYGQKTAVSD